MGIGLSDADEKAAWVRNMIHLWWGREYASVEEQQFWNAYLNQHGADLTLAAIYDHGNAAELRAKRGW